ncbi:putative signal transducing protein [Govanella unica]|uniref:DUF2007 domain-containing protein n=1 Tax=Govanella unica TaxID=2975056 RepID=A0A9X3TYT5_9PROT|nr:DUF2007 domain-containing protein [Govania unica]
MKEVVRTTNWVLISRLTALLEGEGIVIFRFDSHMSAVEGMIGVFPQRIVVADEDEDRARRLIRSAGFGDALYEGEDSPWF